MATYNKRGYKAPKPEEEKDSGEFAQYGNVNEANSKTAEVFNSLDVGASRMESWVARYQKAIFGIVGAVAIATLGYAAYGKFVVEPKNKEASNEMFQAQSYYSDALYSTDKAASYRLALDGGEGKLGFLGIISSFGGTDAANLAHYYAGTCYLNLGEFQQAIEHLSKFKSNDVVVSALATGAIGDAFSELGQQQDAFDYYKKAAALNKNELTTPRFLNKAGLVALELGNKSEALSMFNEIKNNFQSSAEASSIEANIGLAQ